MMSSKFQNNTASRVEICFGGRKMAARGKKAAEDPQIIKWSSFYMPKLKIKLWKQKNKLEMKQKNWASPKVSRPAKDGIASFAGDTIYGTPTHRTAARWSTKMKIPAPFQPINPEPFSNDVCLPLS